MMLLALKPDDRNKYERYAVSYNVILQYFLDDKRWEEIIEMFIKESYALHSLTQEPVLTLTIQAGISSLKTIFCDHQISFNESCPTCSTKIRTLGKSLPYSHHANTALRCKMTGEIMDDQNPPLFLPNGNVYSEKVSEILKGQALKEMAGKNNGRVVCPTSKETFEFNELRKVYIC